MTDTIMVTADQMADSLKQRFGDLTDRIEEFRESAKRAPSEVKTSGEAEMMTKFIKQLGAISRQIDNHRKDEGAPYRDATNAINGWFGPYVKTMDGLKADMTKRLNVYQQEQLRIAREKAEAERREAEARALAQAEAARTAEEHEQAANALEQADKAVEARGNTVTDAGTATVRTEWKAVEVDYENVDLTVLRRYIDQAAIDKALRAAIRDGQREIYGAKIVQVSTTVVR